LGNGKDKTVGVFTAKTYVLERPPQYRVPLGRFDLRKTRTRAKEYPNEEQPPKGKTFRGPLGERVRKRLTLKLEGPS